MLFEFSSTIKTAIEVGKYTQIISNGIPIGIAQDTATGGSFAYAVGALVDEDTLSPFIVPVQFLTTGANILHNYAFPGKYQQTSFIHTGLQSLQTTVGVLQATTVLIELGKISSVVLEAVNLHQTLKLKKEAEQMRLEVKNGFIDLQQAFKDQGAEVWQIVKEVVHDSSFGQHRTVLVRAYELFVQALNRLRLALKLQDIHQRNYEIDSAREILLKVLADYINPRLIETISAPGQLRRFECAWAIEQAIIITYQIQMEMLAVSDRLSHLRHKIKEHTCSVINNCESYDELNFLFPEITRICKHDLAILEIWQARVDWIRSLSELEIKQLASSANHTSEFSHIFDAHQAATVQSVPPEQLAYEDLAKKSHFYSLLDQLIFMFKPILRQEYEVYINQQAHIAGHKILVPKNLQQASDLTVANLYYYFKVRDESYAEATLEAITA